MLIPIMSLTESRFLREDLSDSSLLGGVKKAGRAVAYQGLLTRKT